MPRCMQCTRNSYLIPNEPPRFFIYIDVCSFTLLKSFRRIWPRGFKILDIVSLSVAIETPLAPKMIIQYNKRESIKKQ